MSRIRDPARDKAKELYLSNKDITNREIANILGVDEKKIATWKYRDKWDCSTSKKNNVVQQKGNCSTTNKKKLIQKAKAMVTSGSTIKEASEKTGVSESLLQNYSANENWIEKRENYLKKMYSELLENNGNEHITRVKETLNFLNIATRKTMSDMAKDKLAVDRAVNTILTSIKGQADLLGLTDRAIKNVEEIMTVNKDINDVERVLAKIKGVRV